MSVAQPICEKKNSKRIYLICNRRAVCNLCMLCVRMYVYTVVEMLFVVRRTDKLYQWRNEIRKQWIDNVCLVWLTTTMRCRCYSVIAKWWKTGAAQSTYLELTWWFAVGWQCFQLSWVAPNEWKWQIQCPGWCGPWLLNDRSYQCWANVTNSLPCLVRPSWGQAWLG